MVTVPPALPGPARAAPVPVRPARRGRSSRRPGLRRARRPAGRPPPGGG